MWRYVFARKLTWYFIGVYIITEYYSVCYHTTLRAVLLFFLRSFEQRHRQNYARVSLGSRLPRSLDQSSATRATLNLSRATKVRKRKTARSLLSHSKTCYYDWLWQYNTVNGRLVVRLSGFINIGGHWCLIFQFFLLSQPQKKCRNLFSSRCIIVCNIKCSNPLMNWINYPNPIIFPLNINYLY